MSAACSSPRVSRTAPRRSRRVSGPVGSGPVLRSTAVTRSAESGRTSRGSSVSSVTVTGSGSPGAAAARGAATGPPPAPPTPPGRRSAGARRAPAPPRPPRPGRPPGSRGLREQLRRPGDQRALVGVGQPARRARPSGTQATSVTSTSASDSSPLVGAQQEVVHGLVHPPAVGDEPEVDRAERRDDPPGDPGLLGDLADGGLLGGLARPRCGPSAATRAAGRAGRAGRSGRPPAHRTDASTTSPPAEVSSTRRSAGPARAEAWADRSAPRGPRCVAGLGTLGGRVPDPSRAPSTESAAVTVASGPACRCRRWPTSSASVRARRARAAPGRRAGARRAARPAVPNDLDFTTDARPEQVLELLEPVGRVDLEDRHRLRHGRRPGARRLPGDHHLPGGPLRPGQPQPGGRATATRSPTTCAAATSP